MSNEWITLPIPLALVDYAEDVAGNPIPTFEVKVGMQIELNDGRRFLVGNVNASLGRCSCCNIANFEVRVIRYRIVVPTENL